MLTTSIIIASYRRPAQLAQALRRLPVGPMLQFGAELVLVGSAPDDDTAAVIEGFARDAAFPVRTAMATDPGFCVAQNVGIARSRGDLIVFLDDDCYMDADYLLQLHRKLDPGQFQYGSGEIAPVHADDDPRIANTAWWRFEDRQLIPPNTVIAPGMIQGANMFFLRPVLQATGGVCGVGPADSNDLMTAFLASRAGFTGAMLRGPKVHHDHGRKIGSPESQRSFDIYATIAGSYFAQLAAIGMPAAFDLWKVSVPEGRTGDLRRLEIEFRAAADEIAWMLEARRARDATPSADVAA